MTIQPIPSTTYTTQQHLVREKMFARQMNLIASTDKVSRWFLQGVEKAQLPTHTVPDAMEFDQRLFNTVGWRLTSAEDKYLSAKPWFDHLLEKRFPVTNYIRPMEEFDYTPMPDLFHEYFGHMPQMFQQEFADLELKFAKLFTKAVTPQQQIEIFRLSWYTIEYGILYEDHTTKIASALMSSPGDLQKFIDGGFELVDANLEEIIITPHSPHVSHTKLFVFEGVEHRDHLIDLYEQKYLH